MVNITYIKDKLAEVYNDAYDAQYYFYNKETFILT